MQRQYRKSDLRHIEALYGDDPNGGATKIRVKKELNGGAKIVSKRKCPREAHEQIVAVTTLKKMGIRVHHSPNGGKRNYAEACKLKLMGVSAGYPDLTIPYARKGFHGLLIEIKPLVGGALTETQKDWAEHFMNEGYSWHLARGAQECIRIVQDYFGIEV